MPFMFWGLLLYSIYDIIPTGANVSVRTKDGNSALYLATYGVLNMAAVFSKKADTKVLVDLINAG